ncbi:glutathione S-transferase [Bordetella ansorpii]|uniref:Glutathione S-transferase n=1 Tax=Bordetella ansorpii TaxID=288768 RepID=A0A157S5C1_9BORD|nr:glutathione S-transferase [Bordetella ansorpii]CZZ86804.1 glutathione S-transferase [Bordetella ansorpii]SAI65491.1 glutathione S-transferase [Bordetella ansorpii]
MKLFYSPTSPYVRKCVVLALELGLDGRIERLPAAANPINRDQSIVPVNPLGKVPTLVTDDGLALFDSRVICEYLDALGGGKMFPAGQDRWVALANQALGDGLLDAALLVRYEVGPRPEALRWEDWKRGQNEKITSCLERLEQLAGGFGDKLDIGTITLGCALGYLDFRFAGLDWRGQYPSAAKWFASFNARSSMQQTLPPQ